MNTTRRRALRNIMTMGAGVAVLGSLTGCGIFQETTANGVTTVTINTAQLNTDGQALITAAKSVLAIPLVVAALGPNAVIAQAAFDTASATMASIAQATNGVASASIDTTSVQTFVTSLVADIQKLMTTVNAVLASLASSVAGQVSGYFSAISTLIMFVQLAVSLVPPAGAVLGVHQTEAEALAVATH